MTGFIFRVGHLDSGMRWNDEIVYRVRCLDSGMRWNDGIHISCGASGFRAFCMEATRFFIAIRAVIAIIAIMAKGAILKREFDYEGNYSKRR